MAMTTSKTRRKSHAKRPALGKGSRSDGYALAGRLWVEKDGETYLGWGRVTLLERIAEHGSLNRAARSMEMGYRHAWELLDQMNRLSPKPLVTTSTGGPGGGGSQLTPEGRAAVENFRRLADDFRLWLQQRDPRLWRADRAPQKPARRKGGRTGSKGA